MPCAPAFSASLHESTCALTSFGTLDAPEDPFPVRVVRDLDWLGVPYPALASVVSFEWEPGEAGEKPDMFWYPQMWDWVCSKRAYDVLVGAAASDLHLIAEGRLDGEPVFLVRVVSVLDVVDREHSERVEKGPHVAGCSVKGGGASASGAI
jgi:hypothetical protein